MPALKKKRTSKARLSKFTYMELLTQLLTTTEWMEEDAILTRVVCKKYGITRAKSSRKKSVLVNLMKGLQSGQFRRSYEGLRAFWRLGDGVPMRDSTLENVSVEEKHIRLEASARAAAAKLEASLLDLCLERYHNASGFEISDRIKADVAARIGYTKSQTVHGGEDIIRFASLSNIGWIITNNWSYFVPLFEDMNMFISKIKEFTSFRNRLSHPGQDPLSDDELLYFAVATKLFMRDWGE